MLKADNINKKGYFERKDVIVSNEALFVDACRAMLQTAMEKSTVLQEPDLAGHAWFLGPWALQLGDYHPPAAVEEGIKSAIHHLMEEIKPGQPFALKDPRLCLTIDYWRPYLPAFRSVAIVRHPVEAARSLERLNALPQATNVAAWAIYTSNAIKQVQTHGGLLVLQQDLISRPAAVLERVVKHLDSGGSGVSLEKGVSFLDPHLVRERPIGHFDSDAPPMRAYQFLRQGRLREAALLLDSFIASAIAMEIWDGYCYRLRTFELLHDMHIRNMQIEEIYRTPIIGGLVRLTRRFWGAAKNRAPQSSSS